METQFDAEAEKAVDVFYGLVESPQGRIVNGSGYACGRFTDAAGRYGEDVRLLQSIDDPQSFTLNMNVGDGMALVELQEEMQKRGIRVDTLAAYFADENTQKVLRALSKKAGK